MSWTDQLTITKEAKAVGSAGFDELQPGATVSVRDAAQQMISASDNMATDLLIGRLGPGAVERALVHARPSRPRQHDAVPHHARAVLGRLGQARPARAVEARRHRRAARSCSSRRIPVPTNRIRNAPTLRPRRTAPSGTAAPTDICRVHAALQAAAVGEAAPVTRHPVRRSRHRTGPDEVALHRRQSRKPARRPDLQLVRRRPHRPGVGGQLPAELAAATAARPRRRWLLSIATQAFGLMPVPDAQLASSVDRSVHACPRKCMTVRLAGAMSMRQNDFGGASSATRIAARITAGWVTATIRPRRVPSDSSQPPHPVDQLDDRLAAVRRRGRVGQPDGQLGGQHPAEHVAAPAARSPDRRAALSMIGAHARAVRRSVGCASPGRRPPRR